MLDSGGGRTEWASRFHLPKRREPTRRIMNQALDSLRKAEPGDLWASGEARLATHFLETRHFHKFIATLIYIAFAGTLRLPTPRHDPDDPPNKTDPHNNGKTKSWD